MKRAPGFFPSGAAPTVKVCGLTRAQDVSLCLELGVDFTGFIFAPQSPRRVAPGEAARLPAGKAARVGVFAGQSLDEIRAVMREARLDFAQLHGGEDPEFCRAVGAERVIKTIWPERPGADRAQNGEEFLHQLHALCRPFAEACALYLLDAGAQGGGSGKELQRRGLAAFSPPRPWLLAGGIGPGNARLALSECAPFGLDCNSALESAPGVKDAEKLRALAQSLGVAKAGNESRAYDRGERALHHG